MSKDTVRGFYGQTTHVSRFTRLAEASEAASSSSASTVDLVILPPDDCNEWMSVDVAGPMEVHQYRSDSKHSDADEELEADAGPSSKLEEMWEY